MEYPESYKRILHKLGFYQYQAGLISRYARQKGEWDNHLGECRKFILDAAGIIKPRRVTVLGSGWLLDFPLVEIIDMVDSLILIDIVHPPEVRKQLSGIAKVTLIEDDVTGGLVDEVWQKAGKIPVFKKLHSLNEINVPEFSLNDSDPGMVVSLNILSQLDALPVRLLKRKAKVTTDEINRFRARIQKKHIDFLSRHNSVLITDVSEIFTERDGDSYEEQTLLASLPPSRLRREWTWNFDLTNTDFYGKKSVLKVVAIVL